ncbi:MAG: hypothetical protein U5L07_18355 [Desulfobacterales bacterium]|nr:hypothetical protein [Desulfobacterales bacterium]
MKERILIPITGILLISGILLTGSDSPAFPWPNALGLFSTAAAVFTAHKLNLDDEEAAGPADGEH